MNRSRLYILFALVACFFLFVPQAHSASIKERMAARLPAINTLLDKGVVGENNKGYLEFRVADKASEQLVAEENKDRAAVYAAIGQKQGAPAALVGQRRALMIAKQAQAGRWYQSPDGKWYKK